MKITYLGHSAFILESSVSLLFDPFLRDNPIASLGPDDVVPDYILVSHGHSDHLGDAIYIAKKTKAPIITVNELSIYCSNKGVTSHAMHIGGKHEFSEHFAVKLTPALHGSAVDSDNMIYTGLACGFIVELDGKTIYFAGDTGLTYDMKAVIGDLNDIDVALLPIGDNFTMGPEDAVVAAKWLGAKTVIPMHYNTYPLIQQDASSFVSEVEAKTSAKGVILAPGESWQL
ncbi:MAG: metal-dependent hydrolase [Bacillota bacterium]|nr:metal-dependent hydrolase [Bacillota bacterium]